MDGGAQRATVHGVPKEMAMTKLLKQQTIASHHGELGLIPL